MPRGIALRAVALGLLLLVVAPPLSALALGLHVAGDHDDDAGHVNSIVKLATHGHDHDVAAAEHEHPALRSDGAKAPSPAIVTADGFGADPPPELHAASRGFAAAPEPTGSPPLFRTHCALLL